MTQREQTKIFAKNLDRLLYESGKTQKEVAYAIGVSPQTFNTWIRAIAIPRMNKIQSLANYFGVRKSDLLEPSLSKATNKFVELMRHNEQDGAIFDAVSNVREEDLGLVKELLDRFSGK